MSAKMMSLSCLSLCMFVVSAGGHTLLDMTHTYNNQSVSWYSYRAPFDMRILDNGPTSDGYWYREEEITTGTHVGTHMDAPCHYNQYNWCIDEIPIERLIERPAVLFDIRQRAALEPDSNVTLDDVRVYERKHGRIPDGAIVVMCSGWDDKHPDRAAVFGNDRDDDTDYHFPAFGLDAVTFLVLERGIYGIAVDTPSNDYGPSKLYPVHVFACGNNIYGLESVKNSCMLPSAGATISAFPYKVGGSSGAPTRIYASWEERTRGKGRSKHGKQ